MINYKHVFEMTYKIRFFEKMIEEWFSKGLLRGTTHGSIGQEANSVAVMTFVKDNDFVFGTHRSHGQFIAYSNQVNALISEMMGKKSGVIHGAGGSQHLHYKNFYTNGITGGLAPIAVGSAYAHKHNGNNSICIIFLGDGGFNEGYVQETFNLAQVFKVPVLFVMEDNHYAMSTRSDQYTSGGIKKRIESFDMKYISISTNMYKELLDGVENSFDYVRQNKLPCFCHIDTFRFCGHSKSDKMEYFNHGEMDKYLERDLMNDIKSKLKENVIAQIKKKVEAEIKIEFGRAEKDDELDIAKYRELQDIDRRKII